MAFLSKLSPGPVLSASSLDEQEAKKIVKTENESKNFFMLFLFILNKAVQM
ncbi:hypothetical protein GCM10022259_11760 [Aquimarina mytili]